VWSKKQVSVAPAAIVVVMSAAQSVSLADADVSGAGVLSSVIALIVADDGPEFVIVSLYVTVYG
jgi:hypothetical protein